MNQLIEINELKGRTISLVIGLIILIDFFISNVEYSFDVLDVLDLLTIPPILDMQITIAKLFFSIKQVKVSQFLFDYTIS